jgi:hypothetical protein
MLVGLYIFIDDDFDSPVFAEPSLDEIDEDLWEFVRERTNDAVEGDADAQGVVSAGDRMMLGWRHLVKWGVSFVCVVSSDVKTSQINGYLRALAKEYLDEVDDVRRPDRTGIKDVLVDVIPPWEDEED